ncbi:VanZ family protein [Clostridium folliculivorans]|uniref:Teicoplanin resistance protein VanZ n=1 Tax=Clostridium folliculivorans TaxID=2886038 RepID=A0A9W6DDD9_9CLOT|nr:VanZ family protein [Clostridium folliculivorans]GKU27721.1 teicoplanin resistance protein VanZ [Clostridium folliculivorans]GKU32481.1 teicoplanin resistance protein VanZ [Clostridium folliculivorans]
MDKRNLKLKISWIVLLFWMIIIFVYSSKNGTESDKQSALVIYVFNALGIDLNGMLGDLATFIVRKTAHFTEYLILFLLAYNVFRNYLNKKAAIICGIILTFGYASTDEIHQLFVPGRTGKFRDVLIDTSGSIFGGIVITLINKIRYKSKIVV